ncbi:hypothetical protein H0A36_30325, partial [Endozoicomonas sp. SM1973]
ILSGGTNEAYELLGQRFNNLAVSVGEIFAPALIAVSNLLGEAAIFVQDLIKEFPFVSKAILWGAGAFVALKVAMIAGRTAMLAWNAATLFGLTTANSINLAMVRMGAIHTALAAKTALITAAQWLWNMALMANPISLVITAVGALIGIAAYLVDDWGAGAFVALKVAMIAGRTAMLAWNAATLFGLTTANSINLAMVRMGAIHTALAAKTALITAAQWLWNMALMANPISLV